MLTNQFNLERRKRWLRRLWWHLSDEKILAWATVLVGGLTTVAVIGTVVAQLWIKVRP